MNKKEYTKQEYEYYRIYNTSVSRCTVSVLRPFMKYLRIQFQKNLVTIESKNKFCKGGDLGPKLSHPNSSLRDSKKEAGKPSAHPNKADIERLGTKPQGKSWNI